MSMTEQERLAWEQEQGFISFVTTSNEVYERIAEKELSIEQLKEEMLSLSEYLVLEQEESGNYVLLHALESTPKRFLVNKNRILQIGNTLYKVFEHNVVMADVQHRSTLESLTEKTYRNAISDEIQLMICEDELKDDAHRVILDGFDVLAPNKYRYLIERRNTNGSDRVRIRVGFDINRLRLDNHNYSLWGPLWGEAKAYTRILGIWYENTRTISCEFNILLDELNTSTNTWSRRPYYFSKTERTKTIYHVFDYFDVRIYTSSGTSPNYNNFFNRRHIGATECWAKISNTGRAQLNFNTHLF